MGPTMEHEEETYLERVIRATDESASERRLAMWFAHVATQRGHSNKVIVLPTEPVGHEARPAHFQGRPVGTTPTLL